MSNNFSTNFNKNFISATTLDKAELNADYTVADCKLSPRLQIRFEELGFVKGAKVTVTKKAPLGDPLELTIMGYSLCVRANEAKRITVERTCQ